MITNRELTMQDYVAMLRRRIWIILIPAMMAPLAGYLASYGFPAKYTSQSVVLVEGQKVPESMVQPVVSEDLTARVSTLQQQILAESKLRPMLQRIFPQKSPNEVNGMIDTIRANIAVESVPSDLLAIGTSNPKGKKPNTSPFPGFYVKYTAPNAREAQMICNELTTLLVDENSRQIAEAATGTSEVLNRGIEDAKNNLDGMDAKLAEFKKQYVGQLPGDEENNLKILTGLNSQLESNTQTLNRAQQDKAYATSMLAQQLGAWKTSQNATNPETLQKQLSDLQTQLLQLQSKYTDDHPDVIKTKADIEGVKKKLADINKASASDTDDNTDKASIIEPAEIRQLRLQLHQYEDLIAAATRDQKRLQQEISTYQSRISLSPAVEEQYKQLTRDYDNAQKNYEDLLAKKSSADLTVKMNNQAVGERMFPLQLADLPDSPSFPNRLFFALGGLAAGLAIGAGIALLLELRDNSIRNERDAEAILELPTLIAVPWVAASAVGLNGNGNGNGRFKFWQRKKSVENGSAVLKA
jgi:polysaccharide chain length determinant protein (PEP-CTERM system associated)